MNNLGFLTAAGTALAWGSYMVPFKKFPPQNLVQFQLLIAVSIFISTFLICLIFNYPISLNLYGVVAGIIWAVGNPLSLQAVADLGLSRALPIFLSVIITLSFLWGVLVFGEITTGLPLAFLAILGIIAGVILIASVGNTQSKNVKRGIILSVFSGILFGHQLIPLKLGKLTPEEFFFPMSVGILVFAVSFALFKQVKLKNEGIGVSIFSGLIWNIGNFLSLMTVSLIGLAKGGPIIQFQLLIAVCWGIFYFKEITKMTQKIQIMIGTVIFFIGIIFLAVS